MHLIKNLNLSYRNKANSKNLVVYVNASHAPENDVISISGILIFHQGNLFNWQMKKQLSIARSSTAAKIFAVSNAVKTICLPNMF